MTNFSRQFEISGRLLGGGAPVFFIAEAGVNHFGDLGKALALVDLAAESGADAFKTQAFSTDRLVAATLPEWRDRLRSKEVDFDFVAAMKERCDHHGLPFLCTAHDESVLPWLDDLDVPAFKIGSGERGNLPYLREIARRGKPVILSTGMYALDDVSQAIAVFAAEGLGEIALLHCVTSYPTPIDQVNLRAMDEIRSVFSGPVGYSDHTTGHPAVLAAVARGAEVIEKHITLDFDVPNAQDWKVSAGPDDLAQLIASIREVEAMLGDGVKRAQACEEPATGWALKSLVAANDLPSGTVLSAADLISKRPGGGISPARIDELVGGRLRVPVKADDPVRWGDLES